MKDPLQPMWTTVVDPSEYDIESDMRRMIKLSNKYIKYLKQEIQDMSKELEKRKALLLKSQGSKRGKS
jgi:hypothetical protein